MMTTNERIQRLHSSTCTRTLGIRLHRAAGTGVTHSWTVIHHNNRPCAVILINANLFFIRDNVCHAMILAKISGLSNSIHQHCAVKVDIIKRPGKLLLVLVHCLRSMVRGLSKILPACSSLPSHLQGWQCAAIIPGGSPARPHPPPLPIPFQRRY